MKPNTFFVTISTIILTIVSTAAVLRPSPQRQADAPGPPDHVVKLIFIHHSTGENWLMDDYGDLGRTLGENNYFVSDTNYGWGPDGIGDRTDIPDWEEWFAGSETTRYMNALFNENEQNSWYTRTLSDPGGENEIIMFKSCFPNSDLGGGPSDPPDPDGWLTVGHAKYVYNQILKYFATRPDKLFIVITAPPLSDSTNAANARAFNQWLVNDWLRENDYTLNNVAVFDFYNVLTGPNGRHTFENGREVHVLSGRDTLYYPSDDDHPSVEGSRKATAEFVPLLNSFYHRWQADAPPQSPPEPALYAEDESQSGDSAVQSIGSGLIDDFETGDPTGTNGWEPFWDEATSTSMHCGAESGPTSSGANALILDFDVVPGAWATCALFYDTVQDWSDAEGIEFYLHTAQAGLVFDVNVYAGSRETQETYLYTIEAPAACARGWAPVELRWEDFHRADWEADAGTPFTKSNQVIGMAYGFSTYEDAPNVGTLWVDDVALLGTDSTIVEPPPGQSDSTDNSSTNRSLPCMGALIWPLALAGLAIKLMRG